MTGFDYLMAKGDKNTAYPQRHNAKDFNELCNAILTHRVQISINETMTQEERKAEKRKLMWFSAATRPDATGEERRRKPENIAPCAFGMQDVDGCSPQALSYILPVSARHSVLMYCTASYTDEEPRFRLVFELSRAVEAKDRKRLGEALETMLMQAAGFTLVSVIDSRARWEKGDDYAVFDRTVYGAQSYCYCPHEGALHERYHGEPVDPDALPAPVEPRDGGMTTRKGKSKKARQSDADAADFDDMNAGPDEFVMDDLKSALWFPKMLEKAYDNGAWIDQGYRLASLKGTEYEEAARQMFIDWSVTAADAYPDEELDDVAAKEWDRLEPDKTSYKAIFADAQALGWENPAVWRTKAQNIGKMAASERGELLAHHYGKVALKDGCRVHRYTGQMWEYIPDAEMRRQMAQLFHDNSASYSPQAVKSAIEAMTMQIPLMGETPKTIIGFANGVYDPEAGHFRPHCPEDWLTGHNDVDYTPPVPGENLQNHAPAFWRWLSHAAGNDAQKMTRIMAALFMVLANRYDWQMFIEVTGAGGSGKSVFTGICCLLAGERNATSGNLKDLDDAKERAGFVGRSLIILPDQDVYTGTGSGLKSITGGDAVRVNPKYLAPYDTVIRANVVMTNNAPMHFTERSGGIERRRVIFPFDNEVPAADRDSGLIDKIRGEMPVIVRGLLAQFVQPEEARRLLNEQRASCEAMRVKNESDPMHDFCSYLLGLPQPDGMRMGHARMTRNPQEFIYHAYLTYLEANGYQRMPTLSKFVSDLRGTLRAFGIQLEDRRDGRGKHYNVILKEEASQWIEQDDPEDFQDETGNEGKPPALKLV
ncbi:DNA primase [Salmonella enterica]|nr:DNA primase [Salmonella enterica]EJX3284309.1 DNA primase [Salmonella enterica]